jgi:hypothetical protein
VATIHKCLTLNPVHGGVVVQARSRQSGNGRVFWYMAKRVAAPCNVRLLSLLLNKRSGNFYIEIISEPNE